MRIRPRGAAEDCCCSSLKDNVKWLMERIGGTVRKLIINGNEYTPDGDGTVTLDTSAFVEVDDHLDGDSMKPIANKPVAEAVQELQDKNTLQDAAITDNAGDISDLQEATAGLADRIDANTGDIATLQGSIAGLAADNSYTRGVAQAAKDTADGMAERVTDLETNDAVQQGQIGQLIVADQHNAKLDKDNTFTAGNTFQNSPLVPTAPSGDTSQKAVNTNWASQTGDDAPNNLLHKYANETKHGELTLADRPILKLGFKGIATINTANGKYTRLFKIVNPSAQTFLYCTFRTYTDSYRWVSLVVKSNSGFVRITEGFDISASNIFAIRTSSDGGSTFDTLEVFYYRGSGNTFKLHIDQVNTTNVAVDDTVQSFDSLESVPNYYDTLTVVGP